MLDRNVQHVSPGRAQYADVLGLGQGFEEEDVGKGNRRKKRRSTTPMMRKNGKRERIGNAVGLKGLTLSGRSSDTPTWLPPATILSILHSQEIAESTTRFHRIDSCVYENPLKQRLEVETPMIRQYDIVTWLGLSKADVEDARSLEDLSTTTGWKPYAPTGHRPTCPFRVQSVGARGHALTPMGKNPEDSEEFKFNTQDKHR
ncbi:hypothetical protein BDZ89DRAFT_1037932 [Hymenopellis radicata]|nr:hypothetical protein BDZ89DRAFT_1037932 [Hymenopellis radicata]